MNYKGLNFIYSDKFGEKPLLLHHETPNLDYLFPNLNVVLEILSTTPVRVTSTFLSVKNNQKHFTYDLICQNGLSTSRELKWKHNLSKIPTRLVLPTTLL